MTDRIQVEVDEDLEDLIPGFLENRKNDVSKIKILLDQGSYAEIQAIGHSLKGVGGGYGFDEITRIGAAIETAAKEQLSNGIQAYNEELERYLSAVDIVFV